MIWTKKSRIRLVSGKFIREASRLGDVGPFSGPWGRAGRPARPKNRSGRKLVTAMRRVPLRYKEEDNVLSVKYH